MINGHSLNGSRHLLPALKLAIQQAVLVMMALSDPDRRFRGGLCSTWSISAVDDPGLAYAYNEIRTPKIVPTPRDVSRAEIVDSWLVWLRATEGRRSLYRVSASARGLPIWLLAQQERCTERTIHNRLDRSMAAILREFLDVETDVAPIEEPAALPVRHYHAAWEATAGAAGTRESFGKVYIDGIGYMKDGRRLRDGREKADAKRLYRDRP
jgi:hypothetical protein